MTVVKDKREKMLHSMSFFLRTIRMLYRIMIEKHMTVNNSVQRQYVPIVWDTFSMHQKQHQQYTIL